MPCHQAPTDAGCDVQCAHELYSFSGKVLVDGIVRSSEFEMLVDSGCNLSLFPPHFRKFVVSESKRPVRVQLGSKDSEIIANGKCVVHLPLRAEDGSVRLAREECVFSEQCRCPLFAAMGKDLRMT